MVSISPLHVMHLVYLYERLIAILLYILIDYGIEKKSVLDNLSAKDVEAELEKLVKGSS